MGHIANRSWDQSYESSIIELKKKINGASISVGADIPTGTSINISIRGAEDKKTLLNKSWVQVDNHNFSIDKKG